MKIRKKHDLDARVASELGMSIADTSDVTRAFLEAVMGALTEHEEVHLDGFGRFRLVVEKGQDAVLHNSRGKKTTRKVRILRKFRVHFSRGNHFKRMLRDKYGPSTEKKS